VQRARGYGDRAHGEGDTETASHGNPGNRHGRHDVSQVEFTIPQVKSIMQHSMCGKLLAELVQKRCATANSSPTTYKDRHILTILWLAGGALCTDATLLQASLPRQAATTQLLARSASKYAAQASRQCRQPVITKEGSRRLRPAWRGTF
jgi:hypothetical protein